MITKRWPRRGCRTTHAADCSWTWGSVEGKTAASLSALTPEHLPALVIAPKRVAETVWPGETKKWRPDLRCSVAAGSPVQRLSSLLRPADVVALGRDNMKDLTPEISRLYRTVILDELSGFKDYSSQRWKIANPLTLSMPHVWGLTGTPTPNGLMDLWSQTFLFDRGARLGRNITTYRSRYFYPGRQLPSGVITEWILRDGADEKIHALVEDLFLSMGTEGRIQLPPTTLNKINIALPPKARAVYKKLKRDLVVDLQAILGEGRIHTGVNPAVLTGRLSQVAAGFLYPDEFDAGSPTDIIHREKINAVQEIVEGTGAPVLVFYRFKQEREMLMAALPGAVPIDAPGAIDDWNAGKVPVLVAHPASAGHGLNLQHGGCTIVWTTLPWSLEEWQQGNKRLARQGQKNPVVIHVLLAERTVDSAILETLEKKASVQDALLRHLESPL